MTFGTLLHNSIWMYSHLEHLFRTPCRIREASGGEYGEERRTIAQAGTGDNGGDTASERGYRTAAWAAAGIGVGWNARPGHRPVADRDLCVRVQYSPEIIYP